MTNGGDQDHQDQDQPSALIPFCAFDGLLVGTTKAGLDFPVCNSFFPVIHNGRACFQVNSSRLEVEARGGTSANQGLVLLLDINSDRTSAIVGPYLNDPAIAKEDLEDLRRRRFDTSPGPKSGQAEIYIHTLSPFTGRGPGNYKMSVLKKTSSSDMFLSLPTAKKKCQVELKEKCNVRKWLLSVRSRCNCIPYVLSAFKTQVDNS